MGKPWLVGIEKLHGRRRYQTPPEPQEKERNQQYHIEIAPDLFSHSSDNKLSGETYRTGTPSVEEPMTPSLGGSFTKAL